MRFDQLMEYATQDADPKVFEPLRKPINDRAAAFRQRLVDDRAEPARRRARLRRAGLSPSADRRRSAASCAALYRKLRERGDPARRGDPPDAGPRAGRRRRFFIGSRSRPPGAKPAPVSDWELASRLSYFLWSSMPDDELRAGRRGRASCTTRTCSLAQARRMLQRRRRSAGWRPSSPASGCTSTTSTRSTRRASGTFPTFAELRGAMYEEAIRFFTDLFQHDGSVLDDPRRRSYVPERGAGEALRHPRRHRARVAARRRRQEVRPRRHPRPGGDARQAVGRLAHQPDPAGQLGLRSAAGREAAAAAQGRAAASRRRGRDRRADRPAARREAHAATPRAPVCHRAHRPVRLRARRLTTRSAAAATRTWATGRSTPQPKLTDGTAVRRPRRPAALPADRRGATPSSASSAASCWAMPWAAASSSPTSRCSTRWSKRSKKNDYRFSAALETIVAQPPVPRDPRQGRWRLMNRVTDRRRQSITVSDLTAFLSDEATDEPSRASPAARSSAASA